MESNPQRIVSLAHTFVSNYFRIWRYSTQYLPKIIDKLFCHQFWGKYF
jgi:hypothetical protein